MKSLRWLLITIIVFAGLFPAWSVNPPGDDTKQEAAQSALRKPALTRNDGYRMMEAVVRDFEGDQTIAKQREALTRQNYYDRFWLALGWDVDNTKQSRLAEQSVIHEKYMYLVKSGRFVDSMMIAGDQVLMVEAKSARRELNNPDYIFQAKRYGWASPVADAAVLSNFRDFRAFDTRLRPDYFKPENGEIKKFRLHYTEYLANFDALWDTFAYESVKNGSLKIMLEKIDPALAKKALDMEIVKDFNALRLMLADDIVKNNPEITEEFLNQSVQGLLNRLLLVRILEDRDIEPTKILLMTMLDWGGDAFVQNGVNEVPKKSSSLYAAITTTITDRLHKKYRTPLFAAQPENRLMISDDTMRKIILQLYPADSKNGVGCPYDFALVPTQILGTLYENFLGKRLIIRNGKVIMEDRPSVRAAAGVFYTEEQIASLLVKKTVVPLIIEKTPEEIYQMKFIDPANGCGAITVQVYRALESRLEEYYRKNPDKIKFADSEFPDAILHDDGRVQLSPYVKVKLAKTLYGVDVDAKAVEIATIRFTSTF